MAFGKDVRRVAMGATVAVILMTALACSSDSESTPGADTSGDAEAGGELTIGLPGIPPVFLGMPAFVARDAGLYEEQGVNVTLRSFETGVDAARAVAAGDIDASWSPSTASLGMMSQGVDLVAIQGLNVVDWVMTTTSDDIQSCEDIAGETFNVDAVGGIRYIAAQQMIASCGLTMDDVGTVNLPSAAGLDALLAGQIDVAVLQTDDIAFAADELDREMPIVIRMADVIQNTHNMLLIVQRQTLDDKREELVRMIAGNLSAIPYMNAAENRDKVVDILADATGHTPERAGLALDGYLAIDYWPTDDGLGEPAIDGTIQGQVAAGNIEAGQEPAYGDVIVLDLVEEAMGRL